MTSGRYGLVLREVGRLLGGGTIAALGEGQLLERFAADRDEAAFEALVSRHGPMVLGTCRRMLADPHDVDDAFQATFLVLARRAGSIRDADRLGPWLHGVARRVATRSRALSARRNARERLGGEDRSVELPDASEALELREALDEELSRLPEKYRVPLVLCYLEGLTHDEAAEHLRWPVGTVRSRLAGGRDRLRSRLTRRGLAPSAAVPAILPHASMPQALLSTTVRIATSAGSAPAHVAILAKGALVAMMWNKVKMIAAVGLMAGLAVGGASVAAQKAGDGKEVAPAPAPTIRELAEKLGTRSEQIEEKIDEARREIKRLDAEWHTTRAAIDSLRRQLEAERVGNPSRPVNKAPTTFESVTKTVDEAKPGRVTVPDATKPGPGGIGGASGLVATTGATDPPRFDPRSKQPTVMTLPHNPPVFAVISGERDRVTMIDPATQARSSFRLPKGATEITPVAGWLDSLVIKGPEVTRTALYDRRAGRWYEHDLKEPATEVNAWSGQSMKASGNEPYALQIKAPEVTQLAVFDQGEKKWVTQNLREPARGGVAPTVSPTTAAYRVGRFVYIYSVLAKKWSILESKGEAVADPRSGGVPPGLPSVDGSGKMILPEGELIHIYDAKTGEWTHLDTKDEK